MEVKNIFTKKEKSIFIRGIKKGKKSNYRDPISALEQTCGAYDKQIEKIEKKGGDLNLLHDLKEGRKKILNLLGDERYNYQVKGKPMTLVEALGLRKKIKK